MFGDYFWKLWAISERFLQWSDSWRKQMKIRTVIFFQIHNFNSKKKGQHIIASKCPKKIQHEKYQRRSCNYLFECQIFRKIYSDKPIILSKYIISLSSQYAYPQWHNSLNRKQIFIQFQKQKTQFNPLHPIETPNRSKKNRNFELIITHQ